MLFELNKEKFRIKQKKIFHNYKTLLLKNLMLIYLNFNKEFFLFSDASKLRIGGVLTQFDEKENELSILCAEKVFREAKVNYFILEKEF